MKNKFIKTFDKETAELLENCGFKKISDNYNIYVFINSDKLTFSDEVDVSKIKYTDIICI